MNRTNIQHLRAALTALLLTIVGTWGAEAQAEKQITYKFLNKKGHVAASQYATDNNQKIRWSRWQDVCRSPLGEGFHYYYNCTSNGDGTYDMSSVANEIAESDNLNTGTYNIYVTCDGLKDGQSFINGGWLHITANATTTYLGLNSSGEIYKTSDSALDGYWLLTSENDDPYDVRMVNAAYPNKYIMLDKASNKLVATNDASEEARFALKRYHYNRTEQDYECQFVVVGSEYQESSTSQTRWYTISSNNTTISCLDENRIGGLSDPSGGALITLATSSFTYTYHIVNNAGSIATHASVTTSSATPSVPEAINTPLVSTYRYYSDIACTQPITYLPAANANIYVRYDYDAGGSWLDLSGNTTYEIQENGASQFLFYDSQWQAAQWQSTESETTRWRLEGNDPYDIRILSEYYWLQNGVKRYVMGRGDQNGTLDTRVWTWGTDYGATSAKAKFKRYFLNTGNEIVAADDVIYTKSGTDYFYYLWKANTTKGRFLDGSQKGSTSYALTFIPVSNQSLTYTVLNKQGRKALSKTVTQSNTTALTLSLPDDIRSPLIKNVRYYTSATDNGDGTFTPTGDAVTELAAGWTSQTVYVTYDYRDDTDVNLDPAVKYYMSVGGQYATDDGGTGAMGTAAKSETAAYQWQLDAGTTTFDPYDIRLRLISQSGKYLGGTTYASDVNALAFQTDGAGTTVETFALLGGSGSDKYVLAATTGSDITSRPYAYVGCTGAGNALQLMKSSGYTPLSAATQVTLEMVTNQYTYRVYDNTTGALAIEMTVGQAPGAAPSVPAAIRGAFIDSFEYYASDGTSPMTTLPANDAIIVVKNYVVSATPALDLTGEQKYNLQVNGSYAYDNSGSLALNASAAHTLPYVWALTGGDPYHLSVVNQSTGTLLTQTFILTEGAADGQYELLQASGNSTMNYLGTADGSTTSVASGTWEHKDAAIQLELEAPDVNYTFVIVDLSNKQALQSPAHTGKGGQALVLDEFMQSPLVQTYTFYSTYDDTQSTAAAGLSGDLGGKLPYADCTVYVGYTPYAVADAPLKLDGSVYYGLFSKTKGMDGIFADSQVRGNNTAIPYTDATLNNREKHFYWQLSGTEVSGQYDPYDVRIYNPANERYWTNTIWVAGNQSGSQQVTVHNTSDRYYYMILKGSSGEYVELMSKKRLTDTYYLDRIASYQYIYFDNTKLTTGQHATNYVHGNDNMQFHLQPAYTYHVITLDGKEAISAIGTKMETSTDGATPTAPAIPGLIESPLVNTYHYYDVTAFDIDGDTYTLKEGATQLTRLVDATTKDIYVVYDRSDLSSAIDLTGQMAYNMQVNSRYVYYNSSDNNDFYSTDETTSITDNNYLWQFSGGDPYALKLLNPSKPGFVVSNNDEESSYRGATGLVSPQRAINTYMLLRGYGSDGYDYRLMSSPVAETDKQNNPFYYQYIGGNARNWGRTAGTLNYKVAWVNAGDHGQYLYQTSDLIQLKLTRQNAATYTYTVVSAEGTPLVSYTVNGTAGVTPEIPERIRSPFAKDFTYLDAATGGNVVTATANDATIYVRYALDPEATLDLSGSISYNMQTNGSYAYSNAGALATEATPADRTHDEYIWLIEGSDPYQARLKNVKTGTYLAYEGTTVTFSPTPSTFVMLEGNDSRHVELMATGQDASLTTALNLGRADDATTLALYAQATYAHLAPQLEIAFRKTGSPIHWHIIDNTGREAISYTQIYADDFPALTFANIPAAIRSPYLEDETLTFYTVATEDATAADGRATYILSSPITTIPASGAPHIYVRYTTGHLAAKPLTLDGVNGYDMRLNNHYIYEFNGNLTHNTNIPASGDRSYLWRIAGGDPYAVTVQNAESGLYFRHNISGDTHTLSLDDDEAGRTFIAMQYIDWEDEGNGVARMELMAATGADLSTEHYYSVGRGNENVTLFGSNTHEHGNQMLKVVLHVGLRDISYNIIDRAGKIIATIPYSTGGVASLPDEWKSPMVSRYYYWQASQFVDANTDGVPDEPWTLIDGATETPNEADYPHRQVYVTYDVITNTADANYIDMNTGVTDYSERVRRVSGDDTTPMVRDASKYGTMYMLKFLDGTADYLEDGHDAVLADAYKPVYPYANGDGQMYVRHEEAWEAEKSAGASTRTRWPWFILSPTNDPYHIYITAWQNSHAADNTNYYNFLHTYYNSTIGQVVTSTISDDPRVRLYNATTNPSGSTADAGGSDDNVPTEYMLLGTKGHYRLRTTDAIADATTTSHRDVTTFEQYWKNNPTVLDLAGSNPAANNATLTALGWHRYQAWANAVPFAGGSRVFEHVNHWYKTIDMGAEFDLVPTQIDAVLVLLDNHGWEVMRRNIPKHSETARYAEARQALQLWDSPMVSQYRFYGYRNAPKDAGYHKYTVAANTLEGTAASLADYPERFSGGAIYDLYVHYDVRPEYAQGYTAAATEGESSATAYVIQQGTDYAQAAAAGATAITPVAKADADITSATDDMLWYVQRNFNIDAEMGYVYNDAINGVGSKAETEAAYMASTILSNGLDPYALQLKNKQYGQYFKVTGITAAALNGSSWAYDGTPAVGLSATLDDLTATGNDNVTMHITNATFMAVGDGNGNIRLMPRFDHDRVLTGFATIEAHQAAAPANDDGSHSTQTMLFLLPNPYTYIIVDNSGRESVRFQSAGDVGPQIKAQYRSPLATNFRFYKTAGGTEGSYTFDNADLITTFAGIALTDNKVYVRYDYDRTADVYGLLKGAKATMQIGDTYVQYADDVIKSGTLDNSLAVWQWRLTANVTDSPDPYAVPLYNRNEANAMSAGIPGTSPLTASTTPSRFALLPHATDLSGAPVGTNDYSLLLAGTKTHDNYYYLDGTDLTTGATTAALTPGAATYVPTLTTPQKVHFDFVAPATVTYKLITDDGRVALETTVTPTTPYTAEMPAWMKTPLMTSDAYIYCTSATGSDATTWTVDENSWTQTVLNLGDDNTIYVRYHYDDSKTAVGHSNGRASNVSVLDLSGTVPYYLKLHTWQWTDYDGSKVTIDGEGNNENHINTAALWHLGGNDPYAITFSNYTWDAGKVLSATDPATDKTHTTLTMQERGADGYPHQTFMILSGGTSYIYAYATGSQRLHLSEQGTSTGITLYRDDKDYSAYTDRNQIHNKQPYASFRFYPALFYHVITNAGQEALSIQSPLTLTTVTIEGYKTPLLPANAYHYYTEAPTVAAGIVTPQGDEIAEGTSTGVTAGRLITNLWVRYDAYDRATSPMQYPDGIGSSSSQGLDLSGETWYNMGRVGGKVNYILQSASSYTDAGTQYDAVETGWKNGGDLSPNFWYEVDRLAYLNGTNTALTDITGENGKTTSPRLSAKQMLWRFEGNDPYAIRIYNASQSAGPLTVNDGNNRFSFTATGDYQQFMMLAARGQDDRTVRWADEEKSTYVDCNLFLPTGKTDRFLNIRDNVVTTYNFHYWTGQWALNTRLGRANSGVQGGWVSFFKAPISRRYHYYAMKDDGTGNWVAAWDAVLMHDWMTEIELDNQISRLYTKYERRDEDYSTGTDVTASGDFQTRATLEAGGTNAQFYADADLTTRVEYDGSYDIYPDFEEDSYPNGYPIYFKYQPMTNLEIAALTGTEETNFRWSTEEQVTADVATHQANHSLFGTEADGTTPLMKASWQFMVLDTDAAFTNSSDDTTVGKQYFLRHEDDGTVAWMNNGYQLYADQQGDNGRTLDDDTTAPSRNYKQWSYNRVAEYFKDGENEEFREGRWLWAFVGDPYNLNVVNFEARSGIVATSEGTYALAEDPTTVTAYRDSTLANSTHAYPVMTHTELEGIAASTTSTEHSTTAAERSQRGSWGLAVGSTTHANEATFALVSNSAYRLADTDDPDQLYWQMTTPASGTGHVQLALRATDRSNAIRTLPYEPMAYQDVVLTIRRMDDCVSDADGTKGTGTKAVYYAQEDRMFCAGDVIDNGGDKFPTQARRQFCTYKFYTDKFATLGTEYTVWDASTLAIDNLAIDPNTTALAAQGRYLEKAKRVNGAERWMQSVYVGYEVTTDMFITPGKEPTSSLFSGEAAQKAELQRMIRENDHIYFMDFPSASWTYGNVKHDYTAHAFFRADASKDVFKDYTGHATGDGLTHHYHTDPDRMYSQPENLKWYFVGDPYNLQVFCAQPDMLGQNLCRIIQHTIKPADVVAVDGDNDPDVSGVHAGCTQWQFVHDCVQLHPQDDATEDDRMYLARRNQQTGELEYYHNPNKGQRLYPKFHWEVMCPATGDDERDAQEFSLRYVDEETQLSYRGVYYYLHHGYDKEYTEEVEGQDLTWKYQVDLKYDAGNATVMEKSKYIGYHTANEAGCAIRLVQPARVYIDVHANNATDSQGNTLSDPVVHDELTEYFGVGETLTDMPAHLKREYATYNNLRFRGGADNLSSNTLTLTLDAASAVSHGNTAVQEHTCLSGYTDNYVFKLDVNYSPQDGVFSTYDQSSGELTDPKWFDIRVANRWLYYDVNGALSKVASSESTQKQVVSKYNGNTPIRSKGYHWALVGDPYSLKAVNRRIYEDALLTDNTANEGWLTMAASTSAIGKYASGTPYLKMGAYAEAEDFAFQQSRTYYRQQSNGAETVRPVTDADGHPIYDIYLRLDDKKTKGYSTDGTTKTDETTDLDATTYDADHWNATNDYSFIYMLDERTNMGQNGDGAYRYDFTGLGDYAWFIQKQHTLYVEPNTYQGYDRATAASNIKSAYVRTVDDDHDEIDNDCYDAHIRVYNANGQLMHETTQIEVRYTDLAKGITFDNTIPAEVKRFGCTYRAYLSCTLSGTKATAFANEITASTEVNKAFLDDGSYWTAEKTAGEANQRRHVDIYLTYTVSSNVTVDGTSGVDFAAFFTDQTAAARDEYAWVNSYYGWKETYRVSGSTQTIPVEVPDYDSPILNEDGLIVGYRTKTEYRTIEVGGTANNVDVRGYLNAKTTGDDATTAANRVFGDERQRYDDGTNDDPNRASDQKWAFVGDPYNFELKNYSLYQADGAATALTGSSPLTTSTTATTATHWTLKVGSDGTPYLALLSDDTNREVGTIVSYATFDRASNGQDLVWTRQFIYLTGGETVDPTGQAMNANGAHPFYLVALNSYASVLVYHLIIGHQHQQYNYSGLSSVTGIDGADNPNGLNTDQLTTLKKHIDEIEHYDALRQAAGGAPVKATSLRDIVTYPIEDYSVTRVGIGNALTVPWYMRRQFCKYQFYQMKVEKSVKITQGETAAVNGVEDYADAKALHDSETNAYLLDADGKRYYYVWVQVKDTDDNSDGTNDREAHDDTKVTKVEPWFQDRKVTIAVVYDVDEQQFRFSDIGRRTTAWYTMLNKHTETVDVTDDEGHTTTLDHPMAGLMNFSYKDGIGARLDRSVHYTNNYLWAPVGDPYGFVLHNRYATVNGSGWRNIVVTTPDWLPSREWSISGTQDWYSDSGYSPFKAGSLTKDNLKANGQQLTYTNATDHGISFYEGRVVHQHRTAGRPTDGANNAVYEMMTTNSNTDGTFLMHPTADYINPKDADFDGFYVTHTIDEHKNHELVLRLMDAATARDNDEANWKLETTPEQLLPYFQRSGYVGGLKPEIAATSTAQAYQTQLEQYVAGGSLYGQTPPFALLDNARKLVYSGKFLDNLGNWIIYDPERNNLYYANDDGTINTGLGVSGYVASNIDEASDVLKGSFRSNNLQPLEQGYYRIEAFSREALDADGNDLKGDGSGIKGITGPRFISGYRHLTEQTCTENATHAGTGRWLHFYETDEANRTISTFAELQDKISASNDADRSLLDHPAMAGNIDIPAAEYDAATIFHFNPVEGDRYQRWTFATQGLTVAGYPDAEGPSAAESGNGYTRMISPTETPAATDNTKFRIDDIGGTAVTIRSLGADYDTDDKSSTWRTDVGANIQTNYLCIDAHHRYRITMHTDNEMKEIGDHASHGYHGIQDTKWMLKPVQDRATADPFRHDMPLRLELFKGGVKDEDLEQVEGNYDDNYYASLYVPFDSRLTQTTANAFTYTGPATPGETMNMKSLSTLTDMGNGQYIPAEWPVIVRSTRPTIIGNDATAHAEDVSHGSGSNKYYVELFIPDSKPNDAISGYDAVGGKLSGKYLEQDLGAIASGHRIMVFGLPIQDTGSGDTFTPVSSFDHDYTKRVGVYRNYNWAREQYPNANAHGTDVATAAQRKESYVLANKAYFDYDTTSPSPAPARHYIPMRFDDDDLPPTDPDTTDATTDTSHITGVYDLAGRLIRSRESVLNGTWRRNLPPGMYIVNGRQVTVGR